MPIGEIIPTTGETPAYLLGPTPGAFVAPNISDFGEVLSPGMDTTEADNRAALMRMRMQGQFEFNQLVQKGVRPEQALLQTLPKIFAGEPDKMVKAATDLQEFSAPQSSLVPSMPRIIDLPGNVQARQTGPKTWDYTQKKDESEKIQSDIKKMELNSAMRSLNAARDAAMDGLNPAKKAEAIKAIPSLESRVAELQGQMIAGASPKPIATPSMPASQKSETITEQLPGGGFEIKRKSVQAPVPPAETPAPKTEKRLTESDARNILKEVGGDKEKARKLARERGYVF